MSIASTNPATGEVVRRFSEYTAEQIEERVAKAAQAARTWPLTSFAERAQKLSRAAAVLEERKEALGRLMTIEMGKLRKAAVAEVEKCATACRYYAENAAKHLAPEVVQTDAKRSEKRFQPIGAVLAVVAWDLRFLAAFLFAAA